MLSHSQDLPYSVPPIRHVVVVGCQRSGTTLLGQMLGSHPCAVLIDEGDGLYDWADAIFANQQTNRIQALFRSTCRTARHKYLDSTQRFTIDGNIRSHIRFLVLKAPNLTYQAHEIARFFPNAAIVYALRDIRDVVVSMSKLHNPVVTNQIRLINRFPRIAKRFAAELSILEDSNIQPHRKMAAVAKVKMSLVETFHQTGLHVLTVRYEDLVSDPNDWCSRLTAHAHMPPSGLCRRHHEVMRGLGPGRTERSRPVDRSSVARWITALTPQQEADVWEIAGELLDNLGYQRKRGEQFPPPGLGDGR